MFQSPLVDYVEFPEKGSERKSKREKRSRERKKEGEKWREGPEDRKQKGRCGMKKIKIEMKKGKKEGLVRPLLAMSCVGFEFGVSEQKPANPR